MIEIKDFLETIKYRITETSKYGWQCFSDDAIMMDSWNGEQDGWSASIVFSPSTQEVFEVSVYDYSLQRAYRMVNPDYIEDLRTRYAEDYDVAWDNVKYVDLEVDEDFMTKFEAIVNGKTYDTRVSIPIDLTDSELLLLFKAAHARDVTFNEFVGDAIMRYAESMGKKFPELPRDYD